MSLRIVPVNAEDQLFSILKPVDVSIVQSV